MFDEIGDDIWRSRDTQGIESTDMRDYQMECITGIGFVFRPFETDVQGEGFRAFDIGEGLVDVPAVQRGPQRV